MEKRIGLASHSIQHPLRTDIINLPQRFTISKASLSIRLYGGAYQMYFLTASPFVCRQYPVQGPLARSLRSRLGQIQVVQAKALATCKPLSTPCWPVGYRRSCRAKAFVACLKWPNLEGGLYLEPPHAAVAMEIRDSWARRGGVWIYLGVLCLLLALATSTSSTTSIQSL